MDPNANLREQITIAKLIVAEPERHAHGDVRLAELVLAMNDWITSGGFLPIAWSEGVIPR